MSFPSKLLLVTRVSDCCLNLTGFQFREILTQYISVKLKSLQLLRTQKRLVHGLYFVILVLLIPVRNACLSCFPSCMASPSEGSNFNQLSVIPDHLLQGHSD